MVPLSKFVNFMAFGLKLEPNTIAGKLLHDTQVTYKARGPLVVWYKLIETTFVK